MDWLANDDNPEYHRRVTGPAIVQSIAREGKSAVDAIVIGVGSGGTVTGVGETIKHGRTMCASPPWSLTNRRRWAAA